MDAVTDQLPRWKRILFTAVVLGLTWGFAEVASRAVDRWTYVSIEELRDVYQQRRDWRLGKSWPLQRGDYPYLPYVPNPDHPEVNELGFRGESISRKKPADTFRIVCLGGSTTWNGYPVDLERALSADFERRGLRLQVVNAGNQCWTSMDSLINFITRCLPLDPDAIVVYHAINDAIFSFSDSVSPDYTHLRKRFQKDDPLFWDYLPGWLDRSAAFVEFRAVFERKVGTRGIGIEITKPVDDAGARRYHGLEPFRQNLTTLVDIARARSIETFLCTQVFNGEHPQKSGLGAGWQSAVSDANDITRSFGGRWDDVHVVDVARALAGGNDWMTDFCHFTDAGRARLARFMAEEIRPHIARLAGSRSMASRTTTPATLSAQAGGS